MTLENQVVSLDLAKRLKELGVKQESLFYHWATEVEQDGLTWWTISEKEPRKGRRVRELSTPEHYRGKLSAFTVAELGEMLGNEAASQYLLDAYGYVFNVPDTRFTTVRGVQLCMTDPNIGAKMLIYLLENKLITL